MIRHLAQNIKFVTVAGLYSIVFKHHIHARGGHSYMCNTYGCNRAWWSRTLRKWVWITYATEKSQSHRGFLPKSQSHCRIFPKSQVFFRCSHEVTAECRRSQIVIPVSNVSIALMGVTTRWHSVAIHALCRFLIPNKLNLSDLISCFQIEMMDWPSLVPRPTPGGRKVWESCYTKVVPPRL